MASPATKIFFQPVDSTADRAARLGLTPELLSQVRTRLRRLLLVMLVVVTGSLVVTVLIALIEAGTVASLEGVLIGNLVTIVATGAAYLAMRSRAVRDDLAVWLGFAIELMLAASASLGNYIGYYAQFGHLPMISWTVSIMLVFPLVLPRPPKLTLVMALLAGACLPGAALWLDATDTIRTSADELVGLSINALFAIGIAFFTSRIAYGLTVDADRARKMGSYQLESLLGRGGMGEVWRASHQLLARPAAVKLIRSEPDNAIDSRTLQRFEREAQVTASLKSPHTIELYDFGIADDRSFYYVMELIDGIDLQVLVDRFGPLPANRVAFLLTQICHSLHEAHLAGLVHRDIKPANIFTCRFGAELDFAKVLDFGLVKEAEQIGGDADVNLTAGGMVVGTPACMAPEMALGGDAVDGRADLYALGCVAYWLLTGTMVFSGRSPMEVLVKHSRETPVPPSTHAELPLPPELDELVLRCLAKDPEERPPSAMALTRSLESLPLTPPWTRADARRWWDNHHPVEATAHSPATGTRR